MPPESDAPLADEPQPGAIPNDTPDGAQGPSGLPDDAAPEDSPLGVDPDDEAPGSGAGAMPGIPTDGEPPSGG